MKSEALRLLLETSLALSAAVVAVLILRPIVRRLWGAIVAYHLWLFVPFLALAALLPARPPHALPLAPAPIRPTAEAAIAYAVDWARTATPAAAQASAVDWTAIVLAIWALGALICAGLVLRGQQRTVARLGALTPDTIDGAKVLRAEMAGVGPAVIGAIFPRLVVPADFETRFTASERALILAHEHSHLAAGDPRINGAIALLRCLNWFNPLVHIGALKARVDQELACDAAVVASHPGERRIYAEALLKTQLAAASLPLGCYWPMRSPNLLKERIVMLASTPPGFARRLSGAALIGALSLTAGYAAWAAQPEQAIVAALPLPQAAAPQSPTAADLCLSNSCSNAAVIAGKAKEEAAASANEGTPGVTQPKIELLPKPTEEELATLAKQNEAMNPPAGPNAFQPPLDWMVMMSHIGDMQRASGLSMIGPNGIPEGMAIETLGSVAFADGTSIPPGASVTTGRYSPMTMPEPGGPNYGSYTNSRVDPDGRISISKSIIYNGQPMVLANLKVGSGQTAVVSLPGGATLTLTPTLRPMTEAERTREAQVGAPPAGPVVRSAPTLISAGAASPGQ